MPASINRFERTMEARATVLLVAALMVLCLLGFARLHVVTDELRHSQQQACKLRRQGRADLNLHERIPLRAALAAIGGIGVQSAESQTDPKKRKQALAFGKRFLRYADQIVPLPNPQC